MCCMWWLESHSSLLEFQIYFTKYCCSLYEWDSRDRTNYHTQKRWRKRIFFNLGKIMLPTNFLLIQKKYYLSSLYIMPGVLKNFFEKMDRRNRLGLFISEKFQLWELCRTYLKKTDIKKWASMDNWTWLKKLHGKSFKSICPNFFKES